MDQSYRESLTTVSNEMESERDTHEWAYFKYVDALRDATLHGMNNSDEVLMSVYELEEATLEMIEADDRLDPVEELNYLYIELQKGAQRARLYKYPGLATRLEGRLSVIKVFIETVTAARFTL